MRAKSLVVQEMVLFGEGKPENEIWKAIHYGESIFEKVK